MSIAKRERWTEDEILAFPSGEHAYFDRKSGALLTDKNFEKDLAKALSAFSNSGGGHLLLGIKDDGTFDGVPKIHKGRQRTREWLEQVAPYLVAYPLQDIRIHEVEPSTPSAIPPDKIVIVIDVGDSILAPHQSTIDHLYYYRVGGHSRPAPHFYLDTLRGRERYPGREVAQIWCYVVLNPIINALIREQENLANGKLTWSNHGTNLGEISLISSSTRTGNHEEFFEFHPNVKEGVSEHDSLATAVFTRCSELYQEVTGSSQLLEVYQHSISPDQLQKLRDKDRTLAPFTTDAELLDTIGAPSSDTEGTLKALAEYIVNRRISHGSTLRPLWTPHKDEFLQVLNSPSIAPFNNAWNRARNELQRFDEQFISQLKAIRTQLVRKHAIPVEESSKGRW